jgi:hypothetical protein
MSSTEIGTAAAQTDWTQLREQQRASDWQTRTELLAVARTLLQRAQRNPTRPPSFQTINRMLDLASKLGRIASGIDPRYKQELPASVFSAQFEASINAAVDRVYGKQSNPPDPADDLGAGI